MDLDLIITICDLSILDTIIANGPQYTFICDLSILVTTTANDLLLSYHLRFSYPNWNARYSICDFSWSFKITANILHLRLSYLRFLSGTNIFYYAPCSIVFCFNSVFTVNTMCFHLYYPFEYVFSSVQVDFR